MAEWAETGVPLGMNEPIPPSNGVFPQTGEVTKDYMEEAPEIEMQSHVTNYKSFVGAPEDAEIEVQRYVEKGFAILMDWSEVQTHFDWGTVSRLALIVKTKQDGSVKRRVVVDLLRSGGNNRTVTPEHIVLPRIIDVTRMARDMAERNEADNGTRTAEFVMYDLQDAFCHFPVSRGELANCLAREAGKIRPYSSVLSFLDSSLHHCYNGQTQCSGGKGVAIGDVPNGGSNTNLRRRRSDPHQRHGR